MTSSIDITKPADTGLRLASDIRALAITAKAEIEALQAQIGNGVGQGISYFLTSTVADIPTYDVMSRVPDNTAEVVESTVVNNNTALLDVYIGEPLARVDIPAGEWSFDFFLRVDIANANTFVTLEVLKRAANGTETTLFSVVSPDINNTVVANYNLKTVQTPFTVVSSDRLMLKVWATTTHNQNVIVSLVHSGTSHYSHIVTPLAVETSQSIGMLIAGSSDKTTPVGTDAIAISDSEDSGKLKQFSFSNLATWLATLVINWSGQQTFKETKETVYTITDGAAFEIDPANGNLQIIVLGADRTPLATNFEEGQAVMLHINDGTAYAIAWAGLPVTWVGGATPTLATSGYSVIRLWKIAATIYGQHLGDVA